MPGDREEWGQRVKSIERQFGAARFAVDRLRNDLRRDPTIAGRSPVAPYVADTLRDLAVTYLVRMFAEFESGLRSFWGAVKPGKKPMTEQLINGVASKCRVPDPLRVEVHQVRAYRNRVVHGNEYDEAVTPVSVADARRSLVLFLNRLPFEW
ncbi:MAG: hypothetical protein K2X87_26625 [Gemmataceae bacterium]|nr:hypothetical protein [Gemmataceae bacterium]